MASLIFWRIPCQLDSEVYDIRTKTRKEALKLLYIDPESYMNHAGIIMLEKVTISFSDKLDLLDSCLSEDRGNNLITSVKKTFLSRPSGINFSRLSDFI